MNRIDDEVNRAEGLISIAMTQAQMGETAAARSTLAEAIGSSSTQ